jgi:hypothetical protein
MAGFISRAQVGYREEEDELKGKLAESRERGVAAYDERRADEGDGGCKL